MTIISIIMAFDFGIKNIGIAIGQTLTHTAQPLKVLQSKFGIPNWKMIEYIYNEWQPNILIVGLPLKINGNEQPITILSKNFATQLKKRFNTTVKMHDERFSTIEAKSNYLKYHHSIKTTRTEKTIYINAIAAAVILRSWLNQNKIPF